MTCHGLYRIRTVDGYQLYFYSKAIKYGTRHICTFSFWECKMATFRSRVNVYEFANKHPGHVTITNLSAAIFGEVFMKLWFR